MLSRPRHPSRTTFLLVLLALFAGIAWWWSVRAGRVDVETAPTPITVPAAQSGAAPPIR